MRRRQILRLKSLEEDKMLRLPTSQDSLTTLAKSYVITSTPSNIYKENKDEKICIKCNKAFKSKGLAIHRRFCK